MRYGQGLLEEILRRTDIVQLVGRRVKLTRKGRVFWGCCPFHKEKSPSFKVENERRTYKCFGCGQGGDAFKWLVETEGLTFPEAVERLAGEAGVELPKWTPDDEAREAKRKTLYDIAELTCVFFEERLRARGGEAARAYLTSRGLDDAAIKKFRLGYAPDSNTALIQHLQAKGVPLDDMAAAGVARPAEEGRPARDFFHNRIMFPIGDPRGRIVAFGARALEADAKPKYLNTGETTLFSKGHMLYNFATARAAAIKAGTIVVAEGYMDVIALVRAGFEAAVAPLGTALTENQLTLLWRTAPEPILAFDGDEAGLKAAHRAARLALPHLAPGHSLRFAFLPAGEDPDSLFRAQGSAAIGKVLEAAEPLSQVLWRAETDGRDFSTPERRAGLERALAEIVGQIGNGKIADYYKRDFDEKVFEAFKRRKPAPRGEFRKQGSDRRPGGGFKPVLETVSPAVRNSLLARTGRTGAVRVKEQELGELLLEAPELAFLHGELLAALPFSEPLLDRLRHELLNLAASGFRLESQRLEDHLHRLGLAGLVERLRTSRVGVIAGRTGEDRDKAAGGHADDIEARFLRAAQQLQEMAELEPERKRAMERFSREATEDNWNDLQRLISPRTFPSE
ncbi:MAG TPA: DNA primase [Rhizomicrobium sp.]|nr:DNA primase [Rhizomicrobium sp.]